MSQELWEAASVETRSPGNLCPSSPPQQEQSHLLEEEPTRRTHTSILHTVDLLAAWT